MGILITFLVFGLALIVFLVLYSDHIIVAANKINHNATVLFLFCLGVASTFVGLLLLAHYPNVDHDAGKAAAGLGAMIISGAMMAFRSGSDSSQSVQNPDGSFTTRQASVSGEPAVPVLSAATSIPKA